VRQLPWLPNVVPRQRARHIYSVSEACAGLESRASRARCAAPRAELMPSPTLSSVSACHHIGIYPGQKEWLVETRRYRNADPSAKSQYHRIRRALPAQHAARAARLLLVAKCFLKVSKIVKNSLAGKGVVSFVLCLRKSSISTRVRLFSD
jgi:hypothetical protein